MTDREVLKLALEALLHAYHEDEAHPKTLEAITAIKEALAQPEQEPNKDGSPCPEFWDWLPKAYNFEGDGNFTKYNMEVAFLAGKQATQPEQEPVAWESILGAVARGWCYEENANKTMDSELAVAIAKEVHALYTTPPHRKPLTDDEIDEIYFKSSLEVDNRCEDIYEFARAIEAAHNIFGDEK